MKLITVFECTRLVSARTCQVSESIQFPLNMAPSNLGLKEPVNVDRFLYIMEYFRRYTFSQEIGLVKLWTSHFVLLLGHKNEEMEYLLEM